MAWVFVIGALILVVGGSLLYPWAIRFDKRRRAAKGPDRHPWRRRVIWFAVVLTLAATSVYLLWFAK